MVSSKNWFISAEKQDHKGKHPVPKTNLKNNMWRSNVSVFSFDAGFLDLALSAAPSVARILENDFRFKGTGFKISDKLLMTNSHVLHDAFYAKNHFVEFDYELNGSSRPKTVTRFSLAPNDFFMSSSYEDLDFAIVAIGDRILGERQLPEFGYCPLVDINTENIDKMNIIIHHPGGSYKHITLLNNQVVARSKEVLHYYGETRSGSSGAPVFNSKFELIAMHHYRRPSRPAQTEDGQLGPKDANEGIRICAIIRRIKVEKHKLPEKQRSLIHDALTVPFSHPSLLN